MIHPDFNLLVTLDAVLAEGSVARAAQRLRLSPSAMSRALARLRESTGDPLLVRAGRGLVPTPRALELRERVSQLVDEASAVLRPAAAIDLRLLKRSFTLRTRDGFVESFGAQLIARAASQAPLVRLHFTARLDKESSSLRDALVDLETGVLHAASGPEIRTRMLFRDSFVGVIRSGHALARAKVTAARYAKAGHIGVARRSARSGQLDAALEASGIERELITVVGDFSSALALARQTNLIATVPERQTGSLREGMHTFTLPFATPDITVSMLWHPRHEADPGHRWLRGLVFEVCAASR
ncbi:MAG: LysR family transcriptional regulator [Pseudomonadota bacterium]